MALGGGNGLGTSVGLAERAEEAAGKLRLRLGSLTGLAYQHLHVTLWTFFLGLVPLPGLLHTAQQREGGRGQNQ